jgi:hypothetical protein
MHLHGREMIEDAKQAAGESLTRIVASRDGFKIVTGEISLH